MEAFTYSVSHDLRAPLRIIDGFSQILLEDHADQLDADGKNNLEKIIKNAKRMGRLIDDLLDFSRLGRTEIKVSSIDMNALVQDVLEEIKNSGTKLPDHLEVNALPLSKADYNLLKQVWTNLISNAIKYSGKKKQPEIRIGVITESDKIIYYIKDNGDGFDMQYYSKLFGVFQRLHKESEFTGTGVGLALVQRIILRHGGRVWAEATPGEGATFYFYLPD
ncbi:MAG: ATP-binding protein [Bacteroidota bacterium]